MVKINKTLVGSTLIEAVVAAVVFMTVFACSMDSMVNVLRRADVHSRIVASSDIRRLGQSISHEVVIDSVYTYRWGQARVTVTASPLSDVLSEATITAILHDNSTLITKRLIPTRP